MAMESQMRFVGDNMLLFHFAFSLSFCSLILSVGTARSHYTIVINVKRL